MRQGLSYLPNEAIVPFKGLNTVVEPTVLDPHFTPNVKNMNFTHGVVKKRLGATQLGATLTNPVQEIMEFETAAGVKHLLAFTTTTQFRYDSATSAWVDIGDGSPWTGDEDNIIDYAVGWDDTGKYIYITNGVDEPHKWNGTGNFADININLASFVTCETVDIFNGYLLLGNVTTGTAQPQAIVWSDTSDFDEFNTGNAGTNTLSDIVGDITALKKMGNRLMCYTKGGSIVEVGHIGGGSIFTFRTIMQNFNVLSPRAIVPVASVHLLMTYDNVFMFDGTAIPRPVSLPVQDLIQNSINPTFVNRTFGVFDETRNRVYWIIQTTDTAHLCLMLEYDLFDISRMVWTQIEFFSGLLQPTAAGIFSRDKNLFWNTLADATYGDPKWNDYGDVRWNSKNIQQGGPVMVIGAGALAFMYDEVLQTENGSNITSSWESIDYVVPGVYISQKARWLEVEYEAMNGTIDVSYSTNGGLSWTTLTTGKVLTSAFATYRHYFDTVAQMVRFKITTTTGSGQFTLKWLRAWYKPREEF